MPIKFEVGNIPVAKFVSRTIVDSFIAYFIITISDLTYSGILSSTDHEVIVYVLTTNFHRELVHKKSLHTSPFYLQCYKLLPIVFNCLCFEITGITVIQSSYVAICV